MGLRRHRWPAFTRPTLVTARNADCCAFASPGLRGEQRSLQAKFTSLVSPHPASVVPDGDQARPRRQPRPDLNFEVARPPKWGAPHPSVLPHLSTFECPQTVSVAL